MASVYKSRSCYGVYEMGPRNTNPLQIRRIEITPAINQIGAYSSTNEDQLRNKSKGSAGQITEKSYSKKYIGPVRI